VATLFRWGVRSRLVPFDAVAGVRRPPKASRGAKAVLTAEQAGRLLAAASPAFRVLLRILWLTGARPGEVARLTAADVDVVNCVAVLAEHKTAEKTGRTRVIHLPAEAVSVLGRLAEAYPTGPLLRNSRGGAWTGWAVVKAMEAAREKAGLPDAIAYSMRHTLATDALVKGVPDAHVAELLGHAGTAMLHRHYAHLGAKARVLRQALGSVR
jgi:integrase